MIPYVSDEPRFADSGPHVYPGSSLSQDPTVDLATVGIADQPRQSAVSYDGKVTYRRYHRVYVYQVTDTRFGVGQAGSSETQPVTNPADTKVAIRRGGVPGNGAAIASPHDAQTTAQTNLNRTIPPSYGSQLDRLKARMGLV